MRIFIRAARAAVILCGFLAVIVPIDSAWSQGGSESNNNWGSVSVGTSADGHPTITIGGVTLNVDKSTQKIYDAVVRGENPNEIKKMVLAAEAEQKAAAANDAKQNANKQNEIKDKTNKENTNKLNANTIKSNTNKQTGNTAGGSSSATAVKTKTLTPTTSNAALIKPKK